VRNTPAVSSSVVGLLALGVLAAAAYVARTRTDVSWLEASVAIPAAGFLALLSLSLASRGRALYERSLGRAGGGKVARIGRGLGLLALLLTLTAALALAVFGVLVATDGLTEAPW
jgi:hypothetical protein